MMNEETIYNFLNWHQGVGRTAALEAAAAACEILSVSVVPHEPDGGATMRRLTEPALTDNRAALDAAMVLWFLQKEGVPEKHARAAACAVLEVLEVAAFEEEARRLRRNTRLRAQASRMVNGGRACC